MRSAKVVLWVFMLLLGAGRREAMCKNNEFDLVLDVCEATSLTDAAAKGARLGWHTQPEDKGWRAAFEQVNGGTVKVVGWRRGEPEGDGLLSFWVLSGQQAHTACGFTTGRSGLLEALHGRFGAPDDIEEDGMIVSAFWRRGPVEISFTQVGTTGSLQITRRA